MTTAHTPEDTAPVEGRVKREMTDFNLVDVEMAHEKQEQSKEERDPVIMWKRVVEQSP